MGIYLVLEGDITRGVRPRPDVRAEEVKKSNLVLKSRFCENEGRLPIDRYRYRKKSERLEGDEAIEEKIRVRFSVLPFILFQNRRRKY